MAEIDRVIAVDRGTHAAQPTVTGGSGDADHGSVRPLPDRQRAGDGILLDMIGQARDLILQGLKAGSRGCQRRRVAREAKIESPESPADVPIGAALNGEAWGRKQAGGGIEPGAASEAASEVVSGGRELTKVDGIGRPGSAGHVNDLPLGARIADRHRALGRGDARAAEVLDGAGKPRPRGD
nr:hypothetical protein [Methylorubrum sp. Q1]